MILISRISHHFKKFLSRKPLSVFGQSLAKKIAGTFGLRVIAAFLAFATSVILARFLGVEGFGLYTFALAWTQLLQLPATCGLGSLSVREIAIYQTRSSWGSIRGLINWTNRTVLFLSGGLALIAIGVGVVLDFGAEPQKLWTFSIAMALLPILCLRNLRIGAMQGLNYIVLALVPEHILTPLSIILLTGGAYLLLGDSLTASWAMGLRVVAVTITLFVGIRLLDRVLSIEVKEAIPEYRARTWIRSAIPLMLIGGAFIINAQADLIMLGALRGTEAVGLYFPVARGAQLIYFITMAGNTALSPIIASCYASGENRKLQRTITKTTWAVFATALLMTSFLIIFGHWYLLLFGIEFIPGRGALTILCFGQLVNAATCAVGWLLMMTQYEKYTAFNDGLGAVFNIVLNALFIPRWGIEGAAAASALSLAIVNISNSVIVQRKLGINGTIFVIPWRRDE